MVITIENIQGPEITYCTSFIVTEFFMSVNYTIGFFYLIKSIYIYIYICEVKIVAQACIQKISELPTGIEPVSPDCRFGCFTTRL